MQTNLGVYVMQNTLIVATGEKKESVIKGKRKKEKIATTKKRASTKKKFAGSSLCKMKGKCTIYTTKTFIRAYDHRKVL